MATHHRPLGFGIVGAGVIANYHVAAIKELAGRLDVRLVGVLDVIAESAKTFADRHGLPFHSSDPAVFFAHPEIDVVCVTTPSGAHLEPSLAAVRAGKHLIVEKPLEITTARVDQILASAQKGNVKVAAIFQARFSEGARAVKKAIDDGRFGRISLCSAYVKWHRAPAYYHGWKGTIKLDGGGAIMNQAIHAVDLLQWFGGMPSEVFSWNTRRVHLGIEAEDTACALLKYPDGALGTLEATTAAYPGWERRIEICGEFGSAAIEDDRILKWEFEETREEDAELLATTTTESASGAGSPTQISHKGHLVQIEDMVLALQNDKPLLVDGTQARNTVAVVQAFYESAKTGTPVKIDGNGVSSLLGGG